MTLRCFFVALLLLGCSSGPPMVVGGDSVYDGAAGAEDCELPDATGGNLGSSADASPVPTGGTGGSGGATGGAVAQETGGTHQEPVEPDDTMTAGTSGIAASAGAQPVDGSAGSTQTTEGQPTGGSQAVDSSTGGAPGTGGSQTGGAPTGGAALTGGAPATGGASTGGDPDELVDITVEVPCKRNAMNEIWAWGSTETTSIGLCILRTALFVPDPTWDGSKSWNDCSADGSWVAPTWTEAASEATCDHATLGARCCGPYGLVRFSVTLVNPSWD